MADLIFTRRYDEHLMTLRAEHVRRDRMLDALDHHLPPSTLTCPVPTGGIYLWCHLGAGIDSADLTLEALTAGVAIVGGEVFYPDSLSRDGQQHIRLRFTSVAPKAIDEGIQRLADVLRSPRLLHARDAGTRVLI